MCGLSCQPITQLKSYIFGFSWLYFSVLSSSKILNKSYTPPQNNTNLTQPSVTRVFGCARTSSFWLNQTLPEEQYAPQMRACGSTNTRETTCSSSINLCLLFPLPHPAGSAPTPTLEMEIPLNICSYPCPSDEIPFSGNNLKSWIVINITKLLKTGCHLTVTEIDQWKRSTSLSSVAMLNQTLRPSRSTVWWWLQPPQLSRTITMPSVWSCLEVMVAKEPHSHQPPPSHSAEVWHEWSVVLLCWHHNLR